MKALIGLVAVAALAQPAWIPVFPGCSASPCEVTAEPGAVVTFFGEAFKTAAIAAPVTSDGIGTVIKAFKDGVNVVIKVRERDGGALILTQSAAAMSMEGSTVTTSKVSSRGGNFSSRSSSRQSVAPLWPAFFRAIDPIPEMPPPKPADDNCLVSEVQKAIGFMNDVDDLFAAYSKLFARNGYAVEVVKKRSASMLGKMLYFDVYVWGRSETTTLMVYFHRYNANSRFAVRFKVCRL